MAVAAFALVLLAALVVVEVVAPRVAERALHRALAPCVVAEEVEITELARPVVPQLLVGRARDVEVVATGVQAGELRIDRVRVALPAVPLPWGVGADDDVPPAEVEAQVTVGDARARLEAIAPPGLEPTLGFEDGQVVIGTPRLGLDARFVPVIESDRVSLVPAVGPPSWWTSLGLALAVDLPAGVGVDRIDVEAGRVRIAGSVDLASVGGGSGGSCEEPIAAAWVGAARPSAMVAAATVGTVGP